MYYYDRMRHLICVPYSIENLHKMADDLNIGHHWFHGGKHPHYDIPKRRIEEIASKAVLIVPRAILMIIKTSS